MKNIKLKSFAKINLSLDVKGILENGYHNVEMIMQEVDLCDDVNIIWDQNVSHEKEIKLRINNDNLPTDESNIAYKAAQLMIDKYGDNVANGTLVVEIDKKIPIAAGLAGGSGNGAVVLHGINKLWGLGLNLEELCKLGSLLGADVPFQILCQGKCNPNLEYNNDKSDFLLTCAFATGIGTNLKKVRPFNSNMILVKPNFGVSTKEVYDNIDKCKIEKRPNNKELINCLERSDNEKAIGNMINVMEEYTLKAYPEANKIKEMIKNNTSAKKVLMTGSGPTLFAIYDTEEEAKSGYDEIKKIGYEVYLVKTLI